MEMYIGDDDLRQQENLRNEVLADNLYRTEKKTERQQEQPMADESLTKNVERQKEQPMADESRRTIIIAKIEAELLKRILPSDRNSVMAVKWMKIIKENHQKMASVHKELSRKLQQHEGDSFEESSRDLEEKNQTGILSKKKEEKQFERVTDKRKILINKIQVNLLRTILPSEGTSKMAVKYRKIIQDNHVMMLTVQEKLLKKLKEREEYSIADTVRKLENVNQTKWKATLDAWKEEKRNQILFSTLVDQVRKLQDRHLVLKNLYGELMERAKERENMRQTKKAIEEELLTEIKRKEEMKKRQKMLQMELMKFHLERAVEEDRHFIPRKLFVNNVETFKPVPRLENAPSNVVKDGPSVSTSLTHEDQPQPQPKERDKAHTQEPN